MARKSNYADGGPVDEKPATEPTGGFQPVPATIPHDQPSEGFLARLKRSFGPSDIDWSSPENEAGRNQGGSGITPVLEGLGRAATNVAGLVPLAGEAARGEIDPRDPENVDRAVKGAVGMAELATALPGEQGALGMFAGRKAKTAPVDALNEVAHAQAMHSFAHPGEAARLPDDVARGFWKNKGVDINREGHPMWEIDDSASRYLGQPQPPNRPNIHNFGGDYQAYGNAFNAWNQQRHAMTTGKPLTMKDILDHPDLYKAYPDLADMPVRFDASLDDGMHGFYDRGSKTITLNPNLPRDMQHSTVLHEGQHAVQDIEGWQGGANLDSGKALTDQARTRMNQVEGLKEIYDHLQDGKTPAWIKKQIDQGNLTGGPHELNMAQQIIKDEPDRHGALVQGMYDKALDESRYYRDPFQNYQKFEGEVQARNTGNRPQWLDAQGFGGDRPQGRRTLTPEQRRGHYWKDTEDYQGEPRIRGGDLGDTVSYSQGPLETDSPMSQGGFIEGRNDNDGPKATIRDLLAMPNRKGLNTWDAIKPPSPVKKPEMPMMGTSIRPANEYAGGGSVRRGDLPPDLQSLIDDFTESQTPEDLRLVQIALDGLPDPPLDPYDRGEDYARRFRKGEHPPIVVANGELLDGKHRIWAARQRGDTKSLDAIDLTGHATPRMVDNNRMGKVRYAQGGQVAVNQAARERLFAHLAKGGKPPAIPNPELNPAALEVLRARAQQMELKKSKRIQPNGQEPVFDTSRDAYEQTQKLIPQQDMTHLYPALDDAAEGPNNDRSRPLVQHREDIANHIAQEIEPLKGSNVQYFYHTGPVVQRNMEDGLSQDEAIGSLRRMMGYNSATSPRTETENNLRNGTLLHMFDQHGLPYQGGSTGNLKGFPMMDMHLDLARQFRDGENDFGINTKPSFFRENTSGNLAAGVTSDTHNVRATLMALNRMHPGSIPDEWFGRQEDYPDEPDEAARAEKIAQGALAQYKQNPESFNPAKGINDSIGKSVVQRGQRSQQTEYRRIAAPTALAGQKLGLAPAEAQSLMWFGFGKNTGLKSAPKTLADLLNERVNVTAQVLGIPPQKAWALVRSGKIPLMAQGGQVRA